MATLYITEVQNLAFDNLGNGIAAPKMPPVTEQAVAITGSSTPSNPFQISTRFVLVNCDSACSLAFATKGNTPTAVTTAHRLAANETRFYSVENGDSLAVIANT